MKVQEKEEEEEEDKEERRTAMWYSLVRHIRDQPTGTLMLAIVILLFSSRESLFLAHVTSPLFYFLCLFQVGKHSRPRYSYSILIDRLELIRQYCV